MPSVSPGHTYTEEEEEEDVNNRLLFVPFASQTPKWGERREREGRRNHQCVSLFVGGKSEQYCHKIYEMLAGGEAGPTINESEVFFLPSGADESFAFSSLSFPPLPFLLLSSPAPPFAAVFSPVSSLAPPRLFVHTNIYAVGTATTHTRPGRMGKISQEAAFLAKK